MAFVDSTRHCEALGRSRFLKIDIYYEEYDEQYGVYPPDNRKYAVEQELIERDTETEEEHCRRDLKEREGEKQDGQVIHDG
jgi:hypothetical protein